MAEQNKSVEATVRSIRRATRKKYTAEEKVRIVLEGLRGESTIAELCRKEGIQPNLYYKWSKEFLEAGKQRLIGDTQRQADSQEVVEMRSEIDQLKQVVAELTLKNRVLKKACWGRQRCGTNDETKPGRETRDHPPGGALRTVYASHPGRVERAKEHLLPLVPAIPGGRGRRLDRPASEPTSVLEPHSSSGAGAGGEAGIGASRPVFSTGSLAVHR